MPGRAGANPVWTELSILAANFDLEQSSTFCARPRAGANSVWTELGILAANFDLEQR